jgi:hypothetical protein
MVNIPCQYAGVTVGSKEFREIGCVDVGQTWLARAFAVMVTMVTGS